MIKQLKDTYYGYVYKTTDLSNGLIYVGIHANPFFDKSHYGSGKIILAIIKKCKVNNVPITERFKVEQIDFASNLEELNQKEIYWIKELNARDPNIGYNIGTGGASNIEAGTDRGEEFKRKVSAAFDHKVTANNGKEWHWFDEDKVPEGWVLGELKYSKEEYDKRYEKRKQKIKNYKYYNDGVRNYCLDPASAEAKNLTLGCLPGSHAHSKNRICITNREK